MPGKDRASPDEALLYLHDIRKHLSSVALDESEYFKVLEDAAAAGIVGGSAYDAIIAHCALKANAQSIYTWNVKHYKMFGAEVARRVRTP